MYCFTYHHFNLKRNRSNHCKFFVNFAHTKKLLIFYLFYTSIFIKHLYQFIYSTHLLNKIFIFYNFLLFSLSLPLSLTNLTLPKIQKILNARTTIIIYIYMHGYYNTCASIHNFIPNDVSVFWVTICKIKWFLYFARLCNH